MKNVALSLLVRLSSAIAYRKDNKTGCPASPRQGVSLLIFETILNTFFIPCRIRNRYPWLWTGVYAIEWSSG